MMLLGIVLHAAMFYGASEAFPMRDPHTSRAFDVVVLCIHSFRMPLFFLLSGFFAALLVEKYGIRRAFRNRVDRILVPLLIGVVTLVPVSGWLTLSFGISAEQGARMLWRMTPEHLRWASGVPAKLHLEPGRIPAPAHLWFLYYLMLFYLTLPLCSFADRLRQGAAWLRALSGSAWTPLALGLWTATTLWFSPGGLAGLTYLRPTLGALAYYGSFFLVGCVVHGFRGVLAVATRHAARYALAALLVFLAVLPSTEPDFMLRGTDVPLHARTVVLHGQLTWLLIYASIGVFQRHFDHDSPWVAYISQSSYWVYLIHLPLVAFAAWYLVAVDAPAAVKFGLTASFTALLSFLSYHYLVRRTWISVLLNGRRFSLSWPWLESERDSYSVSMAVVPAPAVTTAPREGGVAAQPRSRPR